MREEEIHCGKDFRNRPDTGRVCRISVQMGRGEKARQRMAGEWIRLFVRWGYALEQEHVRLYDFLSFMKRQMHPCRHFWMRSVYVCAAIRIKRTENLAGLSAEAQKENCRSGRRAGKSLRLPREHFMAKAVQRICDAMKSAENGWKNFWQSHDWNFFKNSGCICLLEC